MSEAGIEASEADRLEHVSGMAPDPGLAEEIKTDQVLVTLEHSPSGRDADPADLAEQDPSARMAEESHDEGGPGDQHSG